MAALDLAENKNTAKVLTFLLLVGSTVLTLVDINAILNIYYAVFALVTNGSTTTAARTQSTLFGSVLMMLLGFGALIFVIYMFEHHMRRAGNPRAMRAVLITLGVQIALALALLV